MKDSKHVHPEPDKDPNTGPLAQKQEDKRELPPGPRPGEKSSDREVIGKDKSGADVYADDDKFTFEQKHEIRTAYLKKQEDEYTNKQFDYSEDLAPVELPYDDYEELRKRNHPFVQGKQTEVEGQESEEVSEEKRKKFVEEETKKAENSVKARKAAEEKNPPQREEGSPVESMTAPVAVEPEPAQLPRPDKIKVWMNLVERTTIEETAKQVKEAKDDMDRMHQAVWILLNGPPQEVDVEEIEEPQKKALKVHELKAAKAAKDNAQEAKDAEASRKESEKRAEKKVG